jgi:hypothetical protein
MKRNKLTATREEMTAKINKCYPGLFTKTTEEFYGKKSQREGIWSGSESGVYASDGFKVLDYYAKNHTAKKRYEIGVHIQLRNLLEKHGWYAEWYDCGTIMFYPI